MAAAPTVFIVDDDEAVRSSLKALLRSQGFGVEAFASAEDFLASGAAGRSGCVIVDIRLPDMDGLALQEELVQRKTGLPVIIVTGHGDVPLAVRAMKAGAIDFLEKPYDETELIDSIQRALNDAEHVHQRALAVHEAEARIATLTERERQVLELLAAGRPNKVIAYELDTSPRTIEIHRARVMEKMQAKSLADLVRMVVSVHPDGVVASR